MAVAAMAAPVPPPPDGFGGTQYVDGRGCVWQRDKTDWAARLDRAGVAVCGFPPTQSARRTDPDVDRVLAPEHPVQPPSPEDILSGQLAAGLRQGEFLADPRPAESRVTPDLPTRPDPVAVKLNALAQREAVLRSALMGGGRSDSDLCRVLGYVPDPQPIPVLGGDVTQGLCPGMRAPRPEERVTEGIRRAPRVAKAAAAPGRGAGPTATTPPPATPAGSGAAQPGGDRRAGAQALMATSRDNANTPRSSSVAARRPDAPSAEAGQRVEMIPASARYVQIGSFHDDQNAVASIRRLSAMGYRVAQQRARKDDKAARVILAGPFTDRRALIAALNRLRADGYPRAVAR